MKKVIFRMTLILVAVTLCACMSPLVIVPPSTSSEANKEVSEPATSSQGTTNSCLTENQAPIPSSQAEGGETVSGVDTIKKANSEAVSSVSDIKKADNESTSNQTVTNAESSESSSSEFVPQPKDPVVLSAETETQIKQTIFNDTVNSLANRPQALEGYSEFGLDGVRITGYYGTYNGCVAVMVYEAKCYTARMWEETVAGVTFEYTDGNSLTVWKDGTVYSLQDAYNQGLLTQEDLTNIAYYRTGN